MTWLAAAADAVRGDVHLELGVGELARRRASGRDAAQHARRPARPARCGLNGLVTIIVGAGLEPANRGRSSSPRAVSIMIGSVGGGRAAAQAAADLDPADPLDHPVEDDDVRLDLVDQDQRFVADRRCG